MKNNELMKLNIQMFAESAANDSITKTDVVDADVADGNENLVDFNEKQDEEDFEQEFSDTADTDDDNSESEKTNEKNVDVTETKAFARRLKEETSKIQIESKNEMEQFAKARGFKDWNELLQASESEQLEKLGINDKEAFDNFLEEKINNNPVVLEAKKVIEMQKQEQTQKILNDEISLISKMDASIKSLDDLAQIPEYDELMDKAINCGYSLSDAFKVVAFDRIKSSVINDSKQAAIDNINSKNHMKTTSGNGANIVIVPDDIMASYRKNMPEMTEEEIKKDYASFLKGGK